MPSFAGKSFKTFRIGVRRIGAGKKIGRARLRASSIGLAGAKKLTSGSRIANSG